MSERSKAWQSKKAQLDKKELEIKQDLEESSSILEGRTKKILTIALIAGGVALAGYLAYRALSKSEEEETEEEKQPETKKKSVSRAGSALGAMITERLISTGLSLLASRFAPKQGKEEGD